MKVLQAAVAAAFLISPAPLLASSANIDAKGRAPTFCNISNEGGNISMSISAEGDALSGDGRYSFIANGNANVLISAVQQVSPNGAAASVPGIGLEDLVVNNSTSSSASSPNSAGVIRKEGIISASIKQNNGARLLTAGEYSLQATATCTSL
jgi:hypothetical protein